LRVFDFEVTRCDVGNRGHGEEIQCEAKKNPDTSKHKTNYICHFVDGPFIDIKGHQHDKSYYQIDFLDPDNNSSVHQQLLRINHWTRPYRKWFTNWFVQVRKNGILDYEHVFDLKGKRALISFDTKSLGDSIAWIPAVEEFRKKNECEVIVSTFWNELFRDTYPNLQFLPPGSQIPNLYASYSIGCYEGDIHKNKFDWRTVPLQKVAFDTLGLDYKEIVTDLSIQAGERTVKEKYVTISEFSTFQCKFWNYPDGWQKIVDWLNDIGYRVMVVSKEETKLKNVINRTNRSIKETITNIYHSEFFMGVSAGPAWVAWALKKPVVMISGYSMPWAEFETNIARVVNENVCHGCFNDINNNFDRGNWMWCPRQEGTERQFECTKTITPEDVKQHIIKIAQQNNIKIAGD
jgi:autotransporter strand-loop-strand O-heptosyltransferase